MSNTSETGHIWNFYHYLMQDLGDRRTNDWFLVYHPYIFIIVGLYIYFVTKLGPKLMENRKPFELKNTLIVYNFIQVLLSVWLFWESLAAAYWDKYSWVCEPVDPSWSPHALRIARGVHIFYMAKIFELLDTIFFILRKKNNQVTYLHLYHHSVMPLVSWASTKYYPGGHGIFLGFVNSFVHIIMYTYYMLSALGPKLQKYLWWKRYITNLQMLQFIIAFIHNSQLLFHDCGYPRWTFVIVSPNAIYFYYLFNEFYNKAYKKQERTVEAQANGTTLNGHRKVN